MRQHYVPRCYLKGFADEKGFLYTANLGLIEKDYTGCPKHRNIKNICFLDDYYSIMKKFELGAFNINRYAELYVERDVLGACETQYLEIRDRFISGNNLTPDDFSYFSDFIVQLKLRNVFWHNKTLDRNIEAWISQSMPDIMSKLSKNDKFSHIPKGIQQLIVNKIKLENISDPEISKKLQLISLIERSDPNNSHNVIIRKALLSSCWSLWEIPEESNQLFITSDNPGFSIDPTGIPLNTKFQNSFIFFLPLTSKHCLQISDIEAYDRPPEFNKHRITDELVRVINFNSSHLINDCVLGLRKDDLKELAKFYHDYLFK